MPYSDGLFALVDSLDRTLGAVATYTAATASSDSSTRDGGEKRAGIRFSDRIRLPFGTFLRFADNDVSTPHAMTSASANVVNTHKHCTEGRAAY